MLDERMFGLPGSQAVGDDNPGHLAVAASIALEGDAPCRYARTFGDTHARRCTTRAVDPFFVVR